MKAYAIYGPPGTGKSHSLIEIASTFAPETKYQFVSHTRAAARELVGRLGDPDKGCTLHSLCYRLTDVSPRSLIDREKLEEFTQKTGIRTTGGDIDDGIIPEGDEYLQVIDYARNSLKPVDQCYDAMGRPGNHARFTSFQQSFKNWKGMYGYVDFTDMLERYVNRPRNPNLHTLLIDEAQDLSPLQWKVVEVLSQYLQVIYIAGDDDQSIYEWGGADPQGMPRFEELHSAQRTVLSQSFRVPIRAHVLAQSVIQRVQSRVAKSYLPTDQTGSIIRVGSMEQIDIDGSEHITVLARDNYKLREIERGLQSRRIPYHVGGNRGPLRTKYGRAMRSYRKVEAGEQLTPQEIKNLYEGTDPKAKSLVVNRDWAGLIKRGWVVSIPMPTPLFDYFNHVDLLNEPKIKMSTIHAAKGTEAENILIYLGRSQRIIEAEAINPDPEHRLFYVAVTRTSNRLAIVDGYGGYRL